MTNLQVTKVSPEQQPTTVEDIQTWIVAYVAELLEVEPELVDPTVSFDRYGMDSSAAFALTGDLEEWLGCEIDPTDIYDYPTIEALSEHLSEMAN